MDTATIAVMVAGGALALNVVREVFGGGWNLSGRLAAMETKLTKEIKASKEEVERRQDDQTRDVGETIAAMRQHMVQIELYIRDHYVRRDSFIEVNRQTQDAIKGAVEDLKGRLDRMEKKLDTKT